MTSSALCESERTDKAIKSRVEEDQKGLFVAHLHVGEIKDDPNAGFDIITCNMAVQDISDIDTMARALPKLLKKGGS